MAILYIKPHDKKLKKLYIEAVQNRKYIDNTFHLFCRKFGNYILTDINIKCDENIYVSYGNNIIPLPKNIWSNNILFPINEKIITTVPIETVVVLTKMIFYVMLINLFIIFLTNLFSNLLYKSILLFIVFLIIGCLFYKIKKIDKILQIKNICIANTMKSNINKIIIT